MGRDTAKIEVNDIEEFEEHISGEKRLDKNCAQTCG